MSGYVPTKNHFREALLFCFHLKKKATEAHQMLHEAYGEHVPSIKTCEFWFRRFKNGDFVIEDKERPGPSNKFEDKELKALLDENPCRTQGELAELLGVSQAAISLRFHKMGVVKKRLSDTSTGGEKTTKPTSSQHSTDMAVAVMLSELPKRAQKRTHDSITPEKNCQSNPTGTVQKR